MRTISNLHGILRCNEKKKTISLFFFKLNESNLEITFHFHDTNIFDENPKFAFLYFRAEMNAQTALKTFSSTTKEK